jgi:hypothetical protein
MANKPDEAFFDRADAHIALSNEQVGASDKGKVSASMLYATARFNTWVTASGYKKGEAMAADRAKIVEYFVAQYVKMLEDHLDDYIEHFDEYMKPTN